MLLKLSAQPKLSGNNGAGRATLAHLPDRQTLLDQQTLRTNSDRQINVTCVADGSLLQGKDGSG
jgi:hypothetical protein